MPPIVLAVIYLISTVLVVDVAWRISRLARRTTGGAAIIHDDGALDFLLGVMPAAAGLATAAAYAVWRPELNIIDTFLPASLISSAKLGLTAGLLCFTVALFICLSYGYSSFSVNPAIHSRHGIQAVLLVGIDLIICSSFEEIVFRGQLMRCLEVYGGFGFAALASSMIFAFLHKWKNRGAPALWVLNTFLFGIVSCYLLKVTGSLAACVMFHFIWNLMETPVFGFPANGEPYSKGIFRIAPSGPKLISGGSWSLDAGTACTVSFLIALFLLVLL